MPRFALLALVAALLIHPALILVDRASQPCGDGLCGFMPGLIIMLALLIATAAFTLTGLRRDERPRWLFALPWVVWAVAAWPLVG